MNWFGRVGDRVVLKINLDFDDYIINKGRVMKIQHNIIDLDGDITLTSLDETMKNIYVNPANIEIWDGMEWEFKVPVFCEIDFKLMASDLTKKSPLMLVNTSIGNRIVIVHSSLLMKAKSLGIKKPNGNRLYNKNRNIIVTECQFSKWIAWAKKVKLSKWKNKPSTAINVKVSIPKI